MDCLNFYGFSFIVMVFFKVKLIFMCGFGGLNDVSMDFFTSIFCVGFFDDLFIDMFMMFVCIIGVICNVIFEGKCFLFVFVFCFFMSLFVISFMMLYLV